ncbi:hypothetical protein RND71_036573 [Anisodus tanguticus]|uniref:Uncharacterized protein n=1 Tax=Anisodus tanguticus TaxID=243964 RepID=A0AAE1UZY9_9SOLA|nr:hypothetical protein RND71_036573 [Anisodus tanguticus]
MPKERRDRSVSFDRSRASPYSCSSSHSRLSLSKNPLENEENVIDWEDARCPVCMEHPHNAILLLCASHEKGCRPFMCDTSYRHSNCFDQFKKSFEEASASTTQQVEIPASASIAEPTTAAISEALSELPGERTEGGSISLGTALSCENHEIKKMLCPLCRGQINDWIVVDSARCYMNAKLRSCSSETCEFTGTYTDLRKHARQEHPLVRPTEADPERQRSWRRLERQRDLGDLLSTLQSSVGEEGSESTSLTFDEGGLLTVFLFVRILQPRSNSRSSSWSGSSRTRAQATGRRRPSRRLWGETYDGEIDSRDDDNEHSDGGSGPFRRLEIIRRQPTPEN